MSLLLLATPHESGVSAHCRDVGEGAWGRNEAAQADIQRRARLTALGIGIVQIEVAMLRSPRALIIHLGHALRRRGWEGHPKTLRLIQ